MMELSKWGKGEKLAWLKKQGLKRSYQDEVVAKINALAGKFSISSYGALSIDSARYPLFMLKSLHWNKALPTVLITGGVHGYETSGIHGALSFAAQSAENYFDNFNFIIAPCVSPWGYETINRWNPYCVDPNRSFFASGPSEEANALIEIAEEFKEKVLVHIDLHETTDSDNEIFLPALDAKEGRVSEYRETPDGFYLVADEERSQSGFQRHMIEHVSKVTHIAPCDEQQKIIGKSISQVGVIEYPVKRLGLCASLTDAAFVTTTEVYPDSHKIDQRTCVLAQVACISSGLDYVIDKMKY
jgi:hypothetical protein